MLSPHAVYATLRMSWAEIAEDEQTRSEGFSPLFFVS